MMSANPAYNSCNLCFSAAVPIPMSTDIIVSVSVVVAVQVHMVAVHVGNNAVLHVYKFFNGACSSPAQAPLT